MFERKYVTLIKITILTAIILGGNGALGFVDGVGRNARFNQPRQIIFVILCVLLLLLFTTLFDSDISGSHQYFYFVPAG